MFPLYKCISKYILHLRVTHRLNCVSKSAKKLQTKLFIYNLLNHFPILNFDISHQKKDIEGKKKVGLFSHVTDTGKDHWFGDR